MYREGDRVRLAGVTGWFVGAKESSVHAAQEAIMAAAGEDVSYDYLVGVSGASLSHAASAAGRRPATHESAEVTG
jgi:hypothetical protein